MKTASGVPNLATHRRVTINPWSRSSKSIQVDPEILSGTPCFAGTRVPIKSLFDHLERGYTVDYFINEFPTVAKHQVIGLLEQVRVKTEAEARLAS